MPLGAEAWGEEAFGLQGAPRKLKDPAASPAVEVVVVPLPCGLVARGLPRKVDRGQKPLLHQGLQVAVHRGQAQGRDPSSGQVQNLLGGEGAACLQEGLPDGPALAGGAFHPL